MKDKSKFIDNLVPQFLLEDENFSVFVDLIKFLNELDKNNISSMDKMLSIDDCPDEFFKYLAGIYGYELRENIPLSKQRELLHNIFDVYQFRGTNKSILYAASYGDYEGWVAGDIFFHGMYEQRPLGSILDPSDKIFIWNKTLYSGSDRFTSSSWRNGIIYVTVPRISDKIREAVLKVTPAGIKVFFNLNPTLSPQEVGIVPYTYDIFDTHYPQTNVFIDKLFQNLSFKPDKVNFYRIESLAEQLYKPSSIFSHNFKYSANTLLSGYVRILEDNPTKDLPSIVVLPYRKVSSIKDTPWTRYPVISSPFYTVGSGEFSLTNSGFNYEPPAEIKHNQNPFINNYIEFSDYTKGLDFRSDSIYLEDVIDIDLFIDSMDGIPSFDDSYGFSDQGSVEIIFKEA